MWHGRGYYICHSKISPATIFSNSPVNVHRTSSIFRQDGVFGQFDPASMATLSFSIRTPMYLTITEELDQPTESNAHGIDVILRITRFCDRLPSEHHDRGLRIGPRRAIKGGAVDHPQCVHSHDLVVAVDDLPHLATAVVVPYGHHRVTTVLLQRDRRVPVLGQQVDRRAQGHVEQLLHREVVVGEVDEGPRLDHPLDGRDPLDAPPEVLRVLEVVEGD